MTVSPPVYMDNHATTRVDPRVVEAMLPYFTASYGNSGSTSHVFGWEAKAAIDEARESVAAAIGAAPREVVFTSGATESNNLAIRGVTERTRRRGNHIVSVTTEHRAVLDPLDRLSRHGFEITLLPVDQAGSPTAGRITAEQVASALREDTCLVSVMLANNEIGVIQPLAEIGALCKERGVPLHCDATQAVGKIPVNVESLQIDLMSFTAHKIYGPKGMGVLYVRRRTPAVRLDPQIHGGGQESGLRSGTLNTPGIVGLAAALRICLDEMDSESHRLAALRNKLFAGLRSAIPDAGLNGPALDDSKVDAASRRMESVDAASRRMELRLPANLNCSFPLVDGEALMMSMKDLAVSSGSACTSANPEPSHVLRALGLSDDLTRASLRFGLGRFNTEEEVDYAVSKVAESVHRLRKLSSMA